MKKKLQSLVKINKCLASPIHPFGSRTIMLKVFSEWNYKYFSHYIFFLFIWIKIQGNLWTIIAVDFVVCNSRIQAYLSNKEMTLSGYTKMQNYYYKIKILNCIVEKF